jgi:hypothetical protein
VGFVAEEVALGQMISEYFGSPYQFSFHRQLHTRRLSSKAGTIVQLVDDVPSGFSLTPSQKTKQNKTKQKKKYIYIYIVSVDKCLYYDGDFGGVK